jgi:hypothetical protein
MTNELPPRCYDLLLNVLVFKQNVKILRCANLATLYVG